jgi:predicted glycoside hydrolase/deacetylase ChbG (UPF0249 family)
MAARRLLVVADDYGIGPATSAGILDLCRNGPVTATVLLANSPYAEGAVRDWRAVCPPADLGWHPALTIDRPVCPAGEVPSLVDHDGRFHSLGGLMMRLGMGKIRPTDVYSEFTAQLERFRELTGQWPAVVNSHHHVQVFPLIGAALRAVLRDMGIRPYLRRVGEPLRTLALVSGARLKRVFLTLKGRRESRRQSVEGFPGADFLAGITDPPCVRGAGFFAGWLRQCPGVVVELTCHPGNEDESLLGRDARAGDGQLERRPAERDLLRAAAFRDACRSAGFELVRPSDLIARRDQRRAA